MNTAEELQKHCKNDISCLKDTLRHSEFISNWLYNNPKEADTLAPLCGNLRTYDDIIADICTEGFEEKSEKELLKHLRECKMREYTLIAVNDLTYSKSVKEITAHISAFASAVLEGAYRWALSSLCKTYGEPVDEDGNPVGFCVLGLGKLGGGELNFSSDVDIIYIYGTEKGRTNGENSTDNHIFFSKLAEKITHLIGTRTDDGMVYRVDLRLRPDGDRGSIVMPIRSYEIYYESYGQSWERMMLLKARTVAGDIETGERFIKAVKPFVFRRSLDYKLIDELQEIKKKINRRIEIKGKNVKNVKLGYGGIREIEFIVQTLQILYYPKYPQIHKLSTLESLHTLAETELISEDTSKMLRENYCFLRRLEHMAQIENEQQTHIVPEDSDNFDLYLQRSGFDGRDDFYAQYKKVTNEVNAEFANLFKESSDQDKSLIIFDDELSVEEAAPILEDMGIRDALACVKILRRIVHGSKRKIRLPHEAAILKIILKRLLPDLTEAEDPADALIAFEKLFSHSTTVNMFHDIFSEAPVILSKIENIFSISTYLTNMIIANRNMLEYIYDPKSPHYKADEILEDFRERTAKYEDDIELELETARIRHNIYIFNVGYAYLNKSINVIKMMHSLTELARGVVKFAFEKVYKRLCDTYGTPRLKDGKECGYVIVGMGKIGSSEMSYGSDLDLVFLFEDMGHTDGENQITNIEFFTKMMQRCISYMSSYTRNGILYKIDMRLRPSGSSGTLVTSIPAFREYQMKSALPWEKQALVRAKVVNEENPLADEFYKIKHTCIYDNCPVSSVEDVKYIHDMRMRIEKEKGSPPEKNDIKAGYGGLVDIEFAVQLLQLKYTCRHEELRTTNTHEAMHIMYELGIISGRDFNALHKSYLFFRNLENIIRVYENTSSSRLPKDEVVLGKLGSFFNYKSPAGDLEAEYQATRKAVRAVYNRIIEKHMTDEDTTDN